jgi:putative oxygen-independent coproporphyrinogen III oxidase
LVLPDPVPGSDTTAEPLGVYVHIPFCAARCDYCAFATWTDRPHLIDAYVDAVVRHIESTFAAEPAERVTSVFFGGGTPSLIPAASLTRILAAVPRVRDAEVTVECNPDTVTPELFEHYAQGGVNRVSLGVQSMVPHVLASLGRTHDPDNVIVAARLAREVGFASFNLDLIYGGAGESLADWEATVDRALALEPPHVSAYALTIEAGTPLAADAARHPRDDDQADKYLLATDRFGAAGLDWYEISNWARPGHECRHNGLYWSQGDYFAFGGAAHGHRHGRRFWNVRTPERYIEAVDRGTDVEAGSERLDADERRLEALQLLMRTRLGVPERALDLDDPALEGLVARVDDRMVLTVDGRLLANEVLMRLR